MKTNTTRAATHAWWVSSLPELDDLCPLQLILGQGRLAVGAPEPTSQQKAILGEPWNKRYARLLDAQTAHEQQMAGVVGAGPSMANEAASVAQMTDEQLDQMWADAWKSLKGPISYTLAVRAFARALLAQAAPPAAPVRGNAQSIVARLDWCARMLEDMGTCAKRGDNIYTDVVQVRGAVKAMLEVLAAPAAPVTGESGAVATLHSNGRWEWKDIRNAAIYKEHFANFKMDVYATPPAAEAASERFWQSHDDGLVSRVEPISGDGRHFSGGNQGLPSETMARIRATPPAAKSEAASQPGEMVYYGGGKEPEPVSLDASAQQEMGAGVPDGWKLVPLEPTEDMAKAYLNLSMKSWRQSYSAMLAAAPAAPRQPGEIGAGVPADVAERAEHALAHARHWISSAPHSENCFLVDPWQCVCGKDAALDAIDRVDLDAPSASAQQDECMRSHPHENMSAACEAKTIEARAMSRAAQQDEREARAFEDWLARVCPSGDCEAVQRQWEESSDYADLHDDQQAQADVQQDEREALSEPTGVAAAIHQVRGALELCEPEDAAAFEVIVAALNYRATQKVKAGGEDKRWQWRYETLRALFPSAPSEQELDAAIDAALSHEQQQGDSND